MNEPQLDERLLENLRDQIEKHRASEGWPENFSGALQVASEEIGGQPVSIWALMVEHIASRDVESRYGELSYAASSCESACRW